IYVQGDYPQAERLFAEGLALMRQEGSISHSSVALLYLGHVAREQGDHGRAAALYQESLSLSQGLGDKLRVVRGLDGLATAASARGDAVHAARLLGAAAAVRAALATSLHPMDRPAFERTSAALREALGSEAYAAAVAEGAALSLDQAIIEALG